MSKGLTSEGCLNLRFQVADAGCGVRPVGAKVISVGIVEELKSHVLHGWFSWAMKSRMKTNQE